MSATQHQIASLGKAARDLLRFAWRRKPRLDLLVVNGLMAVGKTFASDPVASAMLFRQAIEPDHLKQHGYKELRWIAMQIRTIELRDPALAVDIYRAAYHNAEASRDTTSMSNSVLLPLSSNKRQDYEAAWFQLSEAIPAILNNNIEAGVRAVVRGLDGYVQRECQFGPYPGEPTIGSFPFGSTNASLKADWSHSWYRGGFQPIQDGPVLLKKFDDFLYRLATDRDCEAKLGQVLATLSQEPCVAAAIWEVSSLPARNIQRFMRNNFSPWRVPSRLCCVLTRGINSGPL